MEGVSASRPLSQAAIKVSTKAAASSEGSVAGEHSSALFTWWLEGSISSPDVGPRFSVPPLAAGQRPPAFPYYLGLNTGQFTTWQPALLKAAKQEAGTGSWKPPPFCALILKATSCHFHYILFIRSESLCLTPHPRGGDSPNDRSSKQEEAAYTLLSPKTSLTGSYPKRNNQTNTPRTVNTAV